MAQPRGRVAYDPASLQDDSPRETEKAGFHSVAVQRAGEKSRARPASFADHSSQARQFYRSQLPPEQAHLASALVFELSKVEASHVREAMVGHLRRVDGDLARRVADGLGMRALPPEAPSPTPVLALPLSPALRLVGRGKDTLEGRCIAVLVGEGSDGTVETCSATSSWAWWSREGPRSTSCRSGIGWWSRRASPAGKEQWLLRKGRDEGGQPLPFPDRKEPQLAARGQECPGGRTRTPGPRRPGAREAGSETGGTDD